MLCPASVCQYQGKYIKTLLLPANSPALSWELYFGDLNSDGRGDFIIPEIKENSTDKTVLHLFVSTNSGYDTKVINIPKEKYTGEGNLTRAIQIKDFNGDRIPDFVIYDSGTYIYDGIGGHGVTPYLFTGSASGEFTQTNLLESAYKKIISPIPSSGNLSGTQTDSTVAVKNIDSADIDGDGDVDLWIESTGAANVSGHFLINNTDNFTVDKDNRIPGDIYWNHDGGTSLPNRFYVGRFLDFNGDNYPDILLGQLKNLKDSEKSILFLNDGKGYFNVPYYLPEPDFNKGYTRVLDGLSLDLNGDGSKELLLLHTRYDVSARFPDWAEPGSTGFYIQVLSFSNNTFEDKTSSFINDQSLWSNYKNPQYARSLIAHDVNNDKKIDILLNYNGTYDLNKSFPKILLNSGGATLNPISISDSFLNFKGGTEPLFAFIDANTTVDYVLNPMIAANTSQLQINLDFSLPMQSKLTSVSAVLFSDSLTAIYKTSDNDYAIADAGLAVGDVVSNSVTLRASATKIYAPKGVVAVLKYEDGSYGLISRSGAGSKASYGEQLFSATGIVSGKPAKLTASQILSKEASNHLDINGDDAIGNVITTVFDNNGSINHADKGLYKTTAGTIILTSSDLAIRDSLTTSTTLLVSTNKAWAVPTGSTIQAVAFTDGGSLEVLTLKGAKYSAQKFSADSGLALGKVMTLKIDQVIAREYYYNFDLNNDGQISLIGQEAPPTGWAV